jgi:hypothetical protein
LQAAWTWTVMCADLPHQVGVLNVDCVCVHWYAVACLVAFMLGL